MLRTGIICICLLATNALQAQISKTIERSELIFEGTVLSIKDTAIVSSGPGVLGQTVTYPIYLLQIDSVLKGTEFAKVVRIASYPVINAQPQHIFDIGQKEIVFCYKPYSPQKEFADYTMNGHKPINRDHLLTLISNYHKGKKSTIR